MTLGDSTRGQGARGLLGTRPLAGILQPDLEAGPETLPGLWLALPLFVLLPNQIGGNSSP